MRRGWRIRDWLAGGGEGAGWRGGLGIENFVGLDERNRTHTTDRTNRSFGVGAEEVDGDAERVVTAAERGVGGNGESGATRVCCVLARRASATRKAQGGDRLRRDRGFGGFSRGSALVSALRLVARGESA